MKSNVGLCILFLTGHLVFGQTDPTSGLQLQFQNFQTASPQEKLFVHIDKTFYLAGETVWFKVYSLDASSHRPFTASSIAYIEIYSKESRAVLQTKVSLLNGSGNGSFILPGFLPTGNYIFRAYTSWMKNFSADFYFEQTLHIVNTLKIQSGISTPKPLPAVQFFPEGGTELVNVDGKMAFKAINSEGHGLDCSGIIVDQHNDTVTRFQSGYKGMGNFQLKPEKNNRYYAVCKFSDTIIKRQLPDAMETGYAMCISDIEPDKLTITVHATADFNNTNIYLFAQTRQIIKSVYTGTIKDGMALFTVDKKNLNDGISVITLFNQQRQPVCERLVFKRPRETMQILANTDHPAYKIRKPVNINLSAAAGGNLSMSVFMIDSLQPVPEENIINYLFLRSELTGKIESPEYYFLNPDSNSDKAIDNLLLTQGWRRFKWNDVLENKKPYFEFLPEVEGPVVNGKILNKMTGIPVASADAYLSVPGVDYAFTSATSNAQGEMRFAFKDIYKNNALVFQPVLSKDSNYRIDITPAYSDKPAYTPVTSLKLSKTQADILLNRSIANQVENTYSIDKKRQFRSSNQDTTSFYGKPGRGYNLDEYTRFQTMEEVMREYVEDVRVRKEGNKFNFKVMDRTFGTYFTEDPLMLVDGIPVTDATKIIELDPLKIKRVEVVMHNYFLGSSKFEGIVNVKSYSGEMGVPLINPNALVVEYDGIQKQREFYSPSYSTPEEQNSHLPDLRNVLYWAPQITTGSDGKSQLSFYTSDMKGKYAVLIQGLSANGIPGQAVSFFEVTDSR